MRSISQNEIAVPIRWAAIKLRFANTTNTSNARTILLGSTIATPGGWDTVLVTNTPTLAPAPNKATTMPTTPIIVPQRTNLSVSCRFGCRTAPGSWSKLLAMRTYLKSNRIAIVSNAIPQIAQKIPMVVPELALGLKFCPNIANNRTSPDRNTIVNCAQNPIQPHSRKVTAIFLSMGWVWGCRYCTNIGVNLDFEVNSRRSMLRCPQRDNLTINDRHEELVSKTTASDRQSLLTNSSDCLDSLVVVNNAKIAMYLLILKFCRCPCW